MTRLRSINPIIPEPQPKPTAASAAPTPTTAGTQAPGTAAAVTTQTPASSLTADTVKVSGSQPAKLEAVQLAPPVSPSPTEIRRLLANPASLSRMYSLIEREPKLAAHFNKPGGEKVLALLKTASQRRLNDTEIRTLQRYLVEQEGAKIAYRGHTTGIDGSYGRLSHHAMLNILTRPLADAKPAETAQPAKPAEVKPEPAPSQPAAETPAAITDQQPVAKPDIKPDIKPEQPSELDSAAVLNQLDATQDLQTLAATLRRLPAAEREKLAALKAGDQTLNQLVETASKRKLNRTETQALQTLLVQSGQSLKYPGHSTGIDGNFGLRSRQALIAVVREQLTGVKAADTKVYPRYEKMLEDRLLDMTMAIGFDEGTIQYSGAHHPEERKLTEGLKARGFVQNEAKAKELLAAAGRTLEAGYAALYVKESIDNKDGQPVHAIVRVVLAGDGSQGAANRKAAIEGMNQSDVFAYGGHGRYGNGPDFDRNYTVTIDWTGVADAPDKGKVVYEDYTHLKDLLGKSDAQALNRLKALEAEGRVTLTPSNDGNIRMSEKPMHTAEFGGTLMGRALEGVSNTLSEEIHGDNYRLWLFEACRTTDFVQPIRNEARENSSLNTKTLDLLTTEQTMYWHNTSNSLLTLIDGVIAKESTDALVSRLKTVNPEQSGKTHGAYGFEENPRR